MLTQRLAAAGPLDDKKKRDMRQYQKLICHKLLRCLVIHRDESYHSSSLQMTIYIIQGGQKLGKNELNMSENIRYLSQLNYTIFLLLFSNMNYM